MIGILYLPIVTFTPGFYHAPVAFLPSTFAMYTSSLGLTSFMDWQGGSKTASGIMWFGIGALLGWPFAGALIVPFVLEDWLITVVGHGDLFETFRKYLDGLVRCLIVLALQVGIDAFFYHKPVVVAWRIVAYNVFGGRNRGPDIFGTEPWDYYFRNLLLNFNIWFILALFSTPLFLFQSIVLKQRTTKQSFLRTLTFLSPFYLWFVIFSTQPHKEERFMFPAYPFLALNAATAFHSLMYGFGPEDASLRGQVQKLLRVLLPKTLPLIAVIVGMARINMLTNGYGAPLQIYNALDAPGMVGKGDVVCFGKDWYRFPSSHFLPNSTHAKFVKSEFDGLLPGQFHEGETGFGMFPGTWLVPPGMNDVNEEDPAKYTDIRHCTYLVDTYMPGMEATEHEPLYVLDQQWEKVSCAQFLDVGRTSFVARALWLPEPSFIPARYRRYWGEHCLLRRKKI
jgi:alpha-1,2-mannosyltransferase